MLDISPNLATWTPPPKYPTEPYKGIDLGFPKRVVPVVDEDPDARPNLTILKSACNSGLAAIEFPIMQARERGHFKSPSGESFKFCEARAARTFELIPVVGYTLGRLFSLQRDSVFLTETGSSLRVDHNPLGDDALSQEALRLWLSVNRNWRWEAGEKDYKLGAGVLDSIFEGEFITDALKPGFKSRISERSMHRDLVAKQTTLNDLQAALNHEKLFRHLSAETPLTMVRAGVLKPVELKYTSLSDLFGHPFGLVSPTDRIENGQVHETVKHQDHLALGAEVVIQLAERIVNLVERNNPNIEIKPYPSVRDIVLAYMSELMNNKKVMHRQPAAVAVANTYP